MPCITIPSVLAAAGGVASSVIGAGAAKSAAKTQADAASVAAANQMKMFDTTNTNLAPFREAGVNALGGVNDLLGNGTAGNAGIMDKLSSMPGYQFALQQGLQATQNGYTANGLGQSGAALKGAANYAEGLAGTQYQNLFSNEMQTAQLGENAAATTGTLGQSAQNIASGYSTSGAAATAAGQVGGANALMGGISTVAGAGGNASLLMMLQQAGMFGPPSSGAPAMNSIDASQYSRIAG